MTKEIPKKYRQGLAYDKLLKFKAIVEALYPKKFHFDYEVITEGFFNRRVIGFRVTILPIHAKSTIEIHEDDLKFKGPLSGIPELNKILKIIIKKIE